MIKIRRDLTGMVFGRLTVIERAEDVDYTHGKYSAWLCQCECGNQKIITGHSLNSGNSTSCGCYNKEINSLRTKKYNRYEINGDVVTMYTSDNIPFIFDTEDLDKVKDIAWYATNRNYINSYSNKKLYIFHRFVTNTPDGMVVDHINGDTLDNRKCNLRICTEAENHRNHKIAKNNTSGCTGVSFESGIQKWRATIKYNGKKIELGSYSNYDDAVAARKEAEKIYFGEFVRREVDAS